MIIPPNSKESNGVALRNIESRIALQFFQSAAVLFIAVGGRNGEENLIDRSIVIDS